MKTLSVSLPLIVMCQFASCCAASQPALLIVSLPLAELRVNLTLAVLRISLPLTVLIVSACL
jgi:hypothetical protein